MSDICTDNRFELIEKYKKKLIESTNIESSQDEIAVLDNLLFRFWQMGWLDRLEQPEVDCQKCVFCGFAGFKQFQTGQPETEERPAVSDLIFRQAAIEVIFSEPLYESGMKKKNADEVVPAIYEKIKLLPSAQPDTDEWCHDCKEYDKEHHCCPRWNRVIRTTLEEAQPDKTYEKGWEE